MSGETWIALSVLVLALLGQLVFVTWRFSKNESILENHAELHKDIKQRLSDGDSRFEKTAVAIAEMRVGISSIVKSMDEIKNYVLKKQEKSNDNDNSKN